MGIGLSEEHRALQDAASRLLAVRCPASVPRELLEAEREELPELWRELAAQGWLSLHLPEEHAGSGAGLVEIAIILEELGRVVAPGPYLPTVLTSTAIAHFGSRELRERTLTGLGDGTLVGAAALERGTMRAERSGDGWQLNGRVRPVLSAHLADVVLVTADTSEGERTFAVESVALERRELASLDTTRRVAEVSAEAVALDDDRRLGDCSLEDVLDLSGPLVAAEAAGIAGWCLDASAEYAKVREQFGKPIGQFQAVKHRCADLLVLTEQARALAWDAARAAEDPAQLPVTSAVARAHAPEAAFTAGKAAIQLHGGIAFTWEHDAHLYLKRATAMRELLGPSSSARRRAAQLALQGARRRLDLELPPEANDHREEVRAFLTRLQEVPGQDHHRVLADEGWIAPHYPTPWGRGAGAVEQLVIDEEFKAARVRRPHLQVGAWAVPTLIQFATPEQQERFVPSTLRGEISWCQMFSEPGAGSDLAALSTKAIRVEGGWQLTGQKVWTSLAGDADYGLCLARTDPDAPKHEGITYFLVDMAADGLDIRPLRELTGHEMFNEIFLSDVFVPDDQVVGEVDDGWRVARETLAHERVAMSSGSSFGGGLESVIKDLAGRFDSAVAPDPHQTLVLDRLGHLLVDALSIAVLGYRSTLAAIEGSDEQAGASVRKLLGVEHEQRVAEFTMELLGSESATTEDAAGPTTQAFLFNRCLTIAGGTSEVQRNVIGERLMGLPRDT